MNTAMQAYERLMLITGSDRIAVSDARILWIDCNDSRQGVPIPWVKIDLPILGAKMNNVRIVMSRHGLGEVFVDGEKILGVRAFEIVAKAGERNTVKLEFTPGEIEVDGIFEVTEIGDKDRKWAKA